MAERFLNAKHWQLFILTFGIPMVIQFALMAIMFGNLLNANNPDPVIIFDYFKIHQIIMVLFIGIIFAWFWSVVTGLQKTIPDKIRFSVTRFKIFFFIPLGYLIFLYIFLDSTFTNVNDTSFSPSQNSIRNLLVIIIPFHFLSMFCIFHSLYFVAKTIKTSELQRKVTFSDFIGEFFLIWFYPIGIWFIQPKINRIIQEKEEIN